MISGTVDRLEFSPLPPAKPQDSERSRSCGLVGRCHEVHHRWSNPEPESITARCNSGYGGRLGGRVFALQEMKLR
jgi:hypothetical protein